jgi:hypothetical protein
MRITEQYTTNTPTKTPWSQQENNGFLHHLSGDEYYVLHQEKMQQSALHFESMHLSPKKHITPPSQLQEHEQPRNATESPNTSTQKESSIDEALTQKQPFCTFLCNNVKTIHDNTKPIVIKPSPAYIEYIKNNVIPDLMLADKDIETTHQTNLHHFVCSKHHVFIHNNEAELSINLHIIPAHEQKKIVQWVRQTVKEKNLLLKKLIINGVPQ